MDEVKQGLGALAAALAKAQVAFGPMKRSKTVNTGTYEFHYAPLDEVFESVRPALAANGLAITQIVESANGEELRLRTLLIHESGAMLESMLPLWVAPDSKAQALGSITPCGDTPASDPRCRGGGGRRRRGGPGSARVRIGRALPRSPARSAGTVGSLNKGVWQCWKSLGAEGELRRTRDRQDARL